MSKVIKFPVKSHTKKPAKKIKLFDMKVYESTKGLELDYSVYQDLTDTEVNDFLAASLYILAQEIVSLNNDPYEVHALTEEILNKMELL